MPGTGQVGEDETGRADEDDWAEDDRPLEEKRIGRTVLQDKQNGANNSAVESGTITLR